MKLIALFLCVAALASCSRVRTVKLASGKVVTMTSADAGIMDDLEYGNYVWVDTLGQKEPYPLIGYREVSEPKYLGRAVQIQILNKVN